MVCQRGAVRVRRRGGRGRDAGRWFVSEVRCGFGGAAGWGVTRADVVRGGLERGAMGCQRGAVRVRRRGGLGRWFGGIAETVTSCNSPGTRIGLPGPSRAHQLARWCRFVSIAHREPLQTALQGTFARAMISRKITEDQRPATHGPQSPVSAQLVHRPSLSCNSSSTRIGLPGHSRAYQLARWHRFVSI